MVNSTLVRFVATLACGFLIVASIVNSVSAQDERDGAITVRGTLVRVAAIGGETTGWAVRLDEAATLDGRLTEALEVDGPVQQFATLEDKRVEATGKVTIRHGVERREWPVLEISNISEIR